MDNIYQYYKDCLKLHGRLARMDYFKRFLALVIPLLIAIFITMFPSMLPSIDSIALTIIFWALIALLVVFAIFAVIAGVMINIRRLHDINLSGWWILGIMALQFVIVLIASFIISSPVIVEGISSLVSIGAYLFYFLMPGTDGPNNYDIQPVVEQQPREIDND